MSYPQSFGFKRILAAAVLTLIMGSPAQGQASGTAGVHGYVRSDTRVEYGAERHTIEGRITDAETGESLPGATVQVLRDASEMSAAPDPHEAPPLVTRGTAADLDGRFSLLLDGLPARLKISFVGYEPQIVVAAEDEARGGMLEIALRPETVSLDAVEVTASAEAAASDMSRHALSAAEMGELPVLLGETDVLRSLQLLPGVQSGSEASSGLYVRGGSPDQNLILLDGVPLYNAAHLFGVFSVFNPDVVDRAEIIKSAFPARYGGRLSSVVNVTTKPGTTDRLRGHGSLGIVSSRVTVEGPVGNEGSSFLISGRRAYADLFASRFTPPEDRKNYNFYDLNAGIQIILSRRDLLRATLYRGHDAFVNNYRQEASETDYYRFENDLSWGNDVGVVEWTRGFDRGHLTARAGFSRYDMGLLFEQWRVRESERPIDTHYVGRYTSLVRDVTSGVDATWSANPRHEIRAGASGILHTFRPGAIMEDVSSLDGPASEALETPTDLVRALETHAYVEDQVALGRNLEANAGLHFSQFDVEGRAYRSLQPRLSAAWHLTDRLALKASFASVEQYVHLLTNSGPGLPTDLWLPSTDGLRPQRARQVAAGVSAALPERLLGLDVTLEVYEKRMDGLIEYREGADFMGAVADGWRERLATGSGRAAGVELLLRKVRGATTGWIGYTLSRSSRRFAELNAGQPFPFRYDRTHDVSVVLTQRLSRRTDVSASWVYGTGQAIWVPENHFYAGLHDPLAGGLDPETGGSFGYGARNNARLPAYHRLDLSLRLHFGNTGGRTLSFGVFNLYNRQNAFYVYPVMQEGSLQYRQMSLFPVLPWASYRFAL
jgi:hypothetical protein